MARGTTAMRRLLGLTLAIAIVGAVAWGLWDWLDRGEDLGPQPIAFNHALHMSKVQGVRCEDCHKFVRKHTFAGVPGKGVCFDCHDPDDLEGGTAPAELGTLMAFAESSGEIPWHRVTATRKDVFFSHRRHVKAGELACEECHPDMAHRTRPPEGPPITIRMKTCIACHEERGASTDCIACHR